jgi:hypothetical protein
VSPTPRPTEKIAPFPETSGVTTDEMQRRDLPLSPFSAPVAANEPPTGPLAVHDPIGMFDVKQPAPGRDLVPGLLALTGGGVPPAPEIAGLLATALRSPAPPQDQNQNVASAAFQSGGTPMTPAYLPTTVGQQTLGLSPFMANMPREFQPPGPQQADLSPFRTTPEQSSFPSTSLLPFQQWPPVTFDWAGPYNFNAWG